MEELVVEGFDRSFKNHGDRYDRTTRMKKKGFFDGDVGDNWSQVLTHTFKRRLDRRRERNADKNFFS